ncbi:protein of unknown function [Paraburkholderia kururiensis]|uniref:hypothetical protein n=1 Tax=Paraburkholderia kururiensis TaxID=984307 RepID=UPI0039A71BEA
MTKLDGVSTSLPGSIPITPGPAKPEPASSKQPGTLTGTVLPPSAQAVPGAQLAGLDSTGATHGKHRKATFAAGASGVTAIGTAPSLRKRGLDDAQAKRAALALRPKGSVAKPVTDSTHSSTHEPPPPLEEVLTPPHEDTPTADGAQAAGKTEQPAGLHEMAALHKLAEARRQLSEHCTQALSKIIEKGVEMVVEASKAA